MSLIYTYQKSKKKNKTKKEMSEYNSWLDSVTKQTTNFSMKNTKSSFVNKKLPVLAAPPGRETKKYPSQIEFGSNCTKPVSGKVYTGTVLLGIGNLHKSNLVPILNPEEAKAQASMRR